MGAFHQGYAVEREDVIVSHVVEAVDNERLLTTGGYPHGDARHPHTMDTFIDLPLSDESKRGIL